MDAPGSPAAVILDLESRHDERDDGDSVGRVDPLFEELEGIKI